MAGLDYRYVGTHDYIQLFQTAVDLDLGYRAIDELFQRMVFNVVMANYDDHTKNFSFLMREGKEWELAPAYDITHSFDSQSKWVSRHQLGVNGRFDQIQREDLLAVGNRFSVARPDAVISDAVELAQSWSDYASKTSLSQFETVRVKADIDKAVSCL
jgi:serine/threonine-protein kinase HipA